MAVEVEQNRNKQRATLRDVAEAADCSVALASHVLNKSYGNISCTEEVRQKIEQTAAELGYSSMRSRHLPQFVRSFKIGVNVAPLAQVNSLVETLTSLERAADGLGYTLVVYGYSTSVKKAISFFEKKLKSSQLDAVVDLTGNAEVEKAISSLTTSFLKIGPNIAKRLESLIKSL